ASVVAVVHHQRGGHKEMCVRCTTRRPPVERTQRLAPQSGHNLRAASVGEPTTMLREVYGRLDPGTCLTGLLGSGLNLFRCCCAFPTHCVDEPRAPGAVASATLFSAWQLAAPL